MSKLTSDFIPNGPRRLRDAVAVEIETEVRSAFAPEMSAAGVFERLLLCLEIRAEIRRRVKASVPDSPHINWIKR